jgi:hypothetical protein
MLPNDQQEVLIRCRNVVSVATFEEATGTFIVRNGNNFHKNEADLKWTVLENHDQATPDPRNNNIQRSL